MKIITSAAALAALTMSVGALAETEKRMEVHVAHDGAGLHEAVEVRLDSKSMGFDLEEMQVGETRSVVDESGRTILITRQEDGYNFNVDGKSIDIPEVDSSYATWVGDENIDVEVHDTAAHSMAMIDGSDDIIIISGTTLDDSTKDSIRAVLQSAGHSEEVKFIDGGEHDGERHVKVIKKRVARTR